MDGHNTFNDRHACLETVVAWNYVNIFQKFTLELKSVFVGPNITWHSTAFHKYVNGVLSVATSSIQTYQSQRMIELNILYVLDLRYHQVMRLNASRQLATTFRVVGQWHIWLPTSSLTWIGSMLLHTLCICTLMARSTCLLPS